MEGSTESIPFTEPELSIEECRNILCKKGEQYTDQEIKEIRTLILKLLEIDFNYYHTCKRKQGEAKIIQLLPKENNYEYKRAA